jgi:hypothetical protein
MRKLTLGLVAASSLVAISAAPAMAQGYGFPLWQPGYYYPNYGYRYYDFAPGYVGPYYGGYSSYYPPGWPYYGYQSDYYPDW